LPGFARIAATDFKLFSFHFLVRIDNRPEVVR
jgi:hypothetical protein